MLKKIKSWYQSIAAQCDPLELEQAGLRLLIAGSFFTYVAFHLFTDSVKSQGAETGFVYLASFLILAALIYFSILYQKGKPLVRRLAGAWLDITGTTLFMSLTSDIGVVLFGVYLWVTFGNGFRYGNKYLYHSQILSIVGFFITIQLSPYWKSNATVGYSMLVMLIILPLYVAKLISRLNEAKLRAEEASVRAAEANLAKTQFVANMSHEIRTPLNGIIGIGTLFKTTPLNADQKDLLKSLESSSKLLLSLLNNVLDFTKIEERKFTIENVEFSPEEAVNDSLEIFRSQANTKGIHLGASFSNTLGNLTGDAFVLRQVLANLVGNAIKFTQEGSVVISAILLKEDTEKSSVRFEVADTGIGIAADKQDKIFESFTQADSSTTRKFGGNGLGLTIAKHMVEQMGGNLHFQSTEGVGSRFWFELTLDKAKVKVVTSQQPIEDETFTTTTLQANTSNVYAASKALNILVCEDESTNQKIITRLLSLPGHQVEIVINGDEMLDALEQRKFDLVITDLNMAGMSGTDALKLYRFTQPQDVSTRFILFTADATLSAQEASVDAGFDAFLTKPIDAATLFNTIERILKLTPNTATHWLNNALNIPANIEAELEADSTQLDLSTLKELEKIGSGDELFMHRLLRNYLADSVKLIYKIESAAKQKQYGDLYDYCHALKGNSLSVGAIQLANTTEVIGKLNATITSNKVMDMLAGLNSDFSKLTLAVEDYLTQPHKARQKIAATKV
jgi:two-component system, sensor histidine kinase RpfC